MSEKVVGGLKWVKGEIALTLRRVRDLVEDYGRSGERHSLSDAVEALFEVRGVLLALQLTLPARLVEEMQRLAEAMADGSAKSPQESAEALMLALIQLPNHLERLDAGIDVGPLSLWPAINDLRESRGVPPLSQAELLVPASVLAEEDDELPSEALEAIGGVLRKVRPHFHRNLVEWYRPETSADGLVKLGRLFHQVHRYLKDGILADLFRLAEAYTAGLQGAQIAAGPAARTLLGHLDRVLKPLTLTPPLWPDAEARELIDELLAALGESEVQLPIVAELLSQYGAAQDWIAPQEGASEALAGLAAAALGEIAVLKERLDLFVRGERDDRTPLDEIRAGLNGLARTLEVAQTGRLPERLRLLADGFGELAMADLGEDVLRLEPLAAELLSLEAVLQAHADNRIPEHGPGSALGLFGTELSAATLREARGELGRVKEAILACQGPGSRPASFTEIPDRLGGIAGALQILGDDHAAALAQSLAVAVRRRYVAAERWPREPELLHLVDAVAALELYIERSEEGESFQFDLIARAAESLAALEQLLGEGLRAVASPAPGAGAGEGSAAPEAPGDLPTTHPREAVGSPISPELLEIFLEEAEEETRLVVEQFARWRGNPGDEVALSSLRRSFHTLKGSGRLVGAERVGDLSQVAEAVLDRVIERSMSPDAALMDYLSEVVGLLPDLVRAEAEGRPLQIADLTRRGESFMEVETVPAAAPGRRAQTSGAKVIPWPTAAAPMAQAAIPASGPKAADAGRDDRLGAPGAATTAAAAEGIADRVSLFASDPELLDIFRTETGEHLESLRAFLGRAAEGDRVPDEATLRALHTLTGSARMAGVDSIADATKAFEVQIRPRQVAASPLDDRLIALLGDAVDAIAIRIDELPDRGPGVASLARVTRKLAESVSPGEAGAEPLAGAIGLARAPEPELAVSALLEEGLTESEESLIGEDLPSLLLDDGLFAQSPDLTSAREPAATTAAIPEPDSVRRDSDLERFFSLPTDLETALGPIGGLDEPAVEVAASGLPVLKGLETDADAPLPDLPLLPLPSDLSGPAAAELAAELERALGELAAGLDTASVGLDEGPAAGGEPPDEGVEPFPEPEMPEAGPAWVVPADEMLASAVPDRGELARAVETDDWIAGHSEDAWADEPPIVDSSVESTDSTEWLASADDLLACESSQETPSPAWPDLAQGALERAEVAEAVDAPEVAGPPAAEDALPQPDEAVVILLPEPAPAAPETPPDLEIAARAFERAPAEQPQDQDLAPPDPELAGLFLEDARDLLDGIDARIREWQLAPQELSVLDGINRLLHTLKGSARLTGLTMIGDLSHALETRLTAVGADRGGVDDTTLELTQRAVDTLSLQVDALEQGALIPIAAELVEDLSRAPEVPVADTGDVPGLAVLRPAAEVRAIPAESAPLGPQRTPLEREGVPTSTVPQIRVRSDLLKRLVDNSGEISLYRSRLTQRNGLLGFGLGELEQTVRRLRDQMRLMEIETETQILFRFEREGAAGKDVSQFDPLELDRFSMLQQLSRSLAETINDLVSLKELLGGYQREVADLLTQQARLAEDLQDGLLRTRMVPFVQVVPRLHRLVRQTADNLGKSARLEVIGPEVELDRTILDRLVAPLEHLLRNAVDHGLERPEARAAAGKPASGVVTLSLTREGNDVVIGLADDGRGLDLDAIRRQAVARGLLAPQVDLADEALMQFVFEPGFTTSGRVTQISGRGVGLDVVGSEIKASNGTIDLRSVPGGGTTFTIRLPLTLAIIEAFLVSAGDTIYAVPHATLEGAARIPRDELAEIYKGKGRDFEHRGRPYRVVYLGGVLDPSQQPDLGERRWLPLLLARVGDLRVALQVDNLIESARIVVKPLGPQLAGVRWLSGGTILPDGRVALILDALALLRSGAIQDYLPTRPGTGAVAESSICVMVVDDSLTVRRVTSRLLRRQNIEVLTAKDGVEALTLLDERVPDLMLLDIEMPRMDGYELTRHIRRSDRLRPLPIIMITSRTGEKHRELAMSLGVNRYLGKPYQESELLDEIGSLLAERES